MSMTPSNFVIKWIKTWSCYCCCCSTLFSLSVSIYETNNTGFCLSVCLSERMDIRTSGVVWRLLFKISFEPPLPNKVFLFSIVNGKSLTQRSGGATRFLNIIPTVPFNSCKLLWESFQLYHRLYIKHNIILHLCKKKGNHVFLTVKYGGSSFHMSV